MQRFFQDSCRCKDLLDTLKSILVTYGWQVAGEKNTESKRWMVLQKVATTGAIMTLNFYENGYPTNYGRLSIIPAFCETDSVDENGVYISAFEPLTFDLNQTYVNSHYGSGYSASINLDTNQYGFPKNAQYNSGCEDSEIYPTHVFYKIVVNDDWMCIRLQGNPAVSGTDIAQLYIGTFEPIKPIFELTGPKGFWGVISDSSWTAVLSTKNLIDGSDADWDVYYDDGNTSYDFWHVGYSEPVIPGEKIITSLFFNKDSTQYPTMKIPESRIVSTYPTADLIDGSTFISYEGKKYLYTFVKSGTPWVINVMPKVENLKVKDTGSNYQISFDIPSDVDNINTVKIYGKIDSQIDGTNDPNAILIYETNTNAGDSITFDDPNNYGSKMYYTVVGYDSSPTPNETMISSENTVLITPNLNSLTPKHGINDHTYDYSVESKRKFAPLFNPKAVFSLEDNADTTDVLAVNGYQLDNAVASANTSAISTPAKYGNGFDLNGNYIYIPWSENWHENNKPLSIKSCWKRPDTASGTVLLFSAYGTGDLIYDFDNKYFYKNNQDYRKIYYDWVDPWLEVWFVLEGNTYSIYANGIFLGNTSFTETYDWNSAYGLYFGARSRYNDTFSNMILDHFEIYDYAVREPQIKYSWNDGNGRLFIPSNYNGLSTIDGMALVADSQSDGYRVIRSLKDSYDQFMNLSGINTINVDLLSSIGGTTFKIILINSNDVEFEFSVDMGTNLMTWVTKTIDVSAISDDDKLKIKDIAIEITDSTLPQIISLKNVIKNS